MDIIVLASPLDKDIGMEAANELLDRDGRTNDDAAAAAAMAFIEGLPAGPVYDAALVDLIGSRWTLNGEWHRIVLDYFGCVIARPCKPPMA